MAIQTSRFMGIAFLLGLVSFSAAQPAPPPKSSTVEAQVVVKHVHSKSDATGNADIVIWLTPIGEHDPPPSVPAARYRMVQKDKQFHPHVLAVAVGAAVDFPNLDPWFHNVFSLYKGEKFDLGLYEAGTSRTVRFDKPGVSLIFCNIHPEMSAYVLALKTPYFAVSNERGQIKIPDVPLGRYQTEVWYERAESADLAKLAREITITEPSTWLGAIEVPESPLTIPQHTNKHGEPYHSDHPPYE
jgi:plastocyanin